MFTITKTEDNRLDIDFSGKLDSDAMRAALDEFMAKSEGITHGRLMYRIGEFNFPTLGALGVELARLPKLLGLIGRFDKAAVVTSKGWVQKASEIEGALIPGLTIKAFDEGAEAAAEAWLAG